MFRSIQKEVENVVVICGVSYQVFTSNHSSVKICVESRFGISYQVFTSNHSAIASYLNMELVYLIKYLHQITANGLAVSPSARYILSSIYIKSQHVDRAAKMTLGYILSSIYIKSQHYVINW